VKEKVTIQDFVQLIPTPIRIVLVDDHALVRAGIRSLLTQSRGISVVGEAGDGYEAIELIREHRPDLVLLDITMQKMNGLETLHRIKKEFPRVRVLVLTMHTNEEYVLWAMQAGASGYLLKGADAGELERAVRAVAQGQTYLSPEISTHVIEEYRRRVSGTRGKRPVGKSPFEQLTARQREILQLIAEGYTTKEIAAKLGLSVKTVETHRMELMKRLDVHDVAGLIRYAIRMGLVSAEK
jgi:DNA-binding NarL/FixJ family response regulator